MSYHLVNNDTLQQNGELQYFDIIKDNITLENCAWSYVKPMRDFIDLENKISVCWVISFSPFILQHSNPYISSMAIIYIYTIIIN